MILKEFLKLFSGIGEYMPKKKEANLCAKIAIELRNACLAGEKIVWFHVPNENNSGARFGRTLNALGRISGAPDYVIITPKKTYLVEIKTDKGRMSENQKLFADWCYSCALDYMVLHSMEQFKDFFGELVNEQRNSIEYNKV